MHSTEWWSEEYLNNPIFALDIVLHSDYEQNFQRMIKEVLTETESRSNNEHEEN